MVNKRSVTSRRAFLGDTAALGAAGFFLPDTLASLCPRSAKPERPDQILVVVELTGGNDGLNTLVPFGDDAYYKARRRIAVPKNRVLELDDYSGLHPSLGALEPLWKRGELALVPGIGYPRPNRSHFHSMDIWHTADPNVSVVRTGWLGRAVDRLGRVGAPAPALALTGLMPVAMRSRTIHVPSIGSISTFQVRDDTRTRQDARLEQRLLRQNLLERRHNQATELVRQSFKSSVFESDKLRDMTRAYRPDADYSRGLGDRLRTVAQLIHAGHQGKVYYTRTGGYDTHTNQIYSQPRLHTLFAGAVAAFFTDLRAKGLADNVVLLAFSEFGRRVQENSSRGTDHGAGGLVFLAGPRVKGGIHGKTPSLTDLDRGDLKFTTDFRSLYATLLDRWLRVPSRDVLGQTFERLDVLHGRMV